MSTPRLPSDWCQIAEQVVGRCEELAKDSEESERLTRRFCTSAMQDAHDRVGAWMTAAGLEVHVDAVGNLIGRDVVARTPGKKRLLLGSHLDTAPNAGKFDGALGVLLSISVAEAVRDTPLPFGLEVIGFSDEEGARYTSPYLGSRGIAGTFDYSILDRPDALGITVRQALIDFGLSPDQIEGVRYDPQELVACIEPHIEQGPILDSENLPLGLVTAFAGQTRLLCQFHGDTGHAGTVPMRLRRDPLVAAARFCQAVSEYANNMSDLRATIGCFQAYPGASNVIPERVSLSLDVRHADDDMRLAAVEELLSTANQIAESTGTRFSIQLREEQPAVNTDRSICDLLAERH